MNVHALINLLHQGQKRKTGEPYTSHLYAVRDILIEEGIRDKTILESALLHDTLEDSDITNEYLALWFGSKVAGIVDVVSKSPAWHTSYCRMKSNLNEMQLAWIQYPEAILIKMADRLHNLRTIQGFSQEKQQAYLRETKEHLLPLFQETLRHRSIASFSFFQPMNSILAKLQHELSFYFLTFSHDSENRSEKPGQTSPHESS